MNNSPDSPTPLHPAPCTLSPLFSKPVDRPIEGVIKADDQADLRLEFEEYVLTNEVAKRLQGFLDAYNNYSGANGVWISGFFGSGKSHLLKILALMLENRPIDGALPLDLFLPKCGDDEFLSGGLKRAVAVPSKSILFNIDQKADTISKKQVDALLAVFVKVFDEMCGYYGKQGHIAQFERDLDSRGLYEPFKEAYKSIAGKEWSRGREQALLEGGNIARAYAQATGGGEEDAKGILDKYRAEYSVSIEDFAEQINRYIQREERERPGFRLNFFVDEVGQYIADQVKLMTNLQTIAESLASKCRGRAWVIVTAQADLDAVVGEMGRQQGNDFSKIQDRFKIRMKLTSADVAEVIQKRLLQKTEDGARLLSEIYGKQANNFRTLFDFADGSRTYRNFQGLEHFVNCYPFIPYQFDLFQAAIQNLSGQNAFEGRHSSVGERSMLGVFQQVAMRLADHECGELATFDLMFEGIRTALKLNIQTAVIQAERSLGDAFAVRVLKALFLVKYVREFKASVRNLCILALDGFDRDIPALRRRMEEALNRLEQETYVERNGEFYAYLTDEEKDVEEAVKNTAVDSSELAAELEKLVFDHVIKLPKIRCDKTGRDYPYSRKLDNRLCGREHELAVHVVSPLDDGQSEAQLRMQSAGASELLVWLPQDTRFVRDLMLYKQTDKYISRNYSVTQQETVRRILSDKSNLNQQRYKELQNAAQSLMGKARLFVAGKDVEPASGDAQTRVARGFQELVSHAYPNLGILRGIAYSEKDIAQIIKQADQGLFGNDAVALDEPEREVFAAIQADTHKGVRTTLKNLLEKFERKPYGWPYAAALCIAAKLWARGKVEVRADGALLEGDSLERALCNTRGHGNVLLKPQIEFGPAPIRALKEFYGDFFDAPPEASEAKPLGEATGRAFKALADELGALADQAAQYPFLASLAPVLRELGELSGKPYDWYLTELTRQEREDALFEMKESVIDPVRRFMNGTQKAIFDSAREFVRVNEANFSYVDGDEADQVIGCLADPECFKGNRMQQVKGRLETLENKVTALIREERARAVERADALKKRLRDMEAFAALNDEQREQLTRPLDEFRAAVEGQKLIAVIRDRLRHVEENEYPQALERLASWTEPTPAATPGGTAEPSVVYVACKSLNVPFDKPWLADEADVERYLQAVRKALLDEISKGKRIQI